MCNTFFGEQIVLEHLGKPWVFAPDPLQQHGGMLLFLVSIVLDDSLELRVFASIGTLVVPIRCLQFFHQGNKGSVHVARFRGQLLYRLVITNAGHLCSPNDCRVPGEDCRMLLQAKESSLTQYPSSFSLPRYPDRQGMPLLAQIPFPATAHRIAAVTAERCEVAYEQICGPAWNAVHRPVAAGAGASAGSIARVARANSASCGRRVHGCDCPMTALPHRLSVSIGGRTGTETSRAAMHPPSFSQSSSDAFSGPFCLLRRRSSISKAKAETPAAPPIGTNGGMNRV